MLFSNKLLPKWATTSGRNVLFQYRKTNWQSRSLPDFIVIGAQKSGTSSLYSHLGQHPELKWPYKKEIHFFDGGLDPKIDDFEKGEVWYRAHFPRKENIDSSHKTFDSSPLYIYNPLAPQRIFNLVPKVKIIAILRNPTERAISHYFHEKRRGRESLSPLEAFQSEDERLEIALRQKNYKHHNFIHFSYKGRGLYYEQLKRYLRYFSMSNILVLDSDSFFANPNNTLKDVYRFVGVDPSFEISDIEPRNVGRNRTNVDPAAYDYLNAYFEPHNKKLYSLLGKSYDWL